MTLHTGLLHRPPPPCIRPLSERAGIALHTVPVSSDWSELCPCDNDPRGNDTFACCVPNADLALIEVVLANVARSGDARWKPTLDMVLSRYAKVTGFDPVTGIPDDGTAVNADLADWITNGIAIPELQRVIAPWWATVDPANDDHIAVAGACAPLLVSLRLWQGWDAIEGDHSAWARPPGALTMLDGFHRVLMVGFFGRVRKVRTWGFDAIIHPDLWRQVVVAVDAVWARDWLDALGTTPMGLDLAALSADMQALAA